MSNGNQNGTAPNAHRLLWAGFMAILAAGVGFSVRGGILGQWADEFGFTMTELGTITGGGLTGFGIVIIATSLVADKIGYGKLMVIAFLLHLISAFITFAAPWAFAVGGKDSAFRCLAAGMFLFSISNGLAEAVVNPLTAALFPKEKTHYLNILHAGWPAGLVVGGLAAAWMGARAVDWKIQMSLFLIPVVIYGVMLFGQRFPRSEAAAAGATLWEMVGTLFAPLMIILLVIHAMVGYVELGTDSWISKITGSIMDNPTKGLTLFVYTSTLMFVLRFFAGPIVHRISPLGLLFVSSILGAVGLTLLGNATTVVFCGIAATVYALGKTFLWPTMLAVVSERFPKGGAVSIGMLGGVGMLSAGLLGGPAIGYQQDKYASEKVKEKSEATFERYEASEPARFLFSTTTALASDKVGVLGNNGVELAGDIELLRSQNPDDENAALKNLESLESWWQEASPFASVDGPIVEEAAIYGGRTALKLTAYVPATMAVLFLCLIIGFRATGGYKAVILEESPESEGTAES